MTTLRSLDLHGFAVSMLESGLVSGVGRHPSQSVPVCGGAITSMPVEIRAAQPTVHGHRLFGTRLGVEW